MFNLFIGLLCLGDAVLDNKEIFNSLVGIGNFVCVGVMIHFYIDTYFIKKK